jgi:hypothetical protein
MNVEVVGLRGAVLHAPRAARVTQAAQRSTGTGSHVMQLLPEFAREPRSHHRKHGLPWASHRDAAGTAFAGHGHLDEEGRVNDVQRKEILAEHARQAVAHGADPRDEAPRELGVRVAVHNDEA